MNGKGGWGRTVNVTSRTPRGVYGSLDPQTVIPYRVGGARVCRGALAFKGVHRCTFGPSQALADRGRGSGENIDSTRNASGSALKRNVRSTVRCLAEFCNSHYVSHFAAVFIVARAKTSTVQSYVFVVYMCLCSFVSGNEVGILWVV